MNYAERDERVVWHPYRQLPSRQPILPIVSAKGAYVFDEKGRRYIDAISSWWVNLHGHSHPVIVEAIANQAATLDHCTFADCTHPKAIELAEKLLTLLPNNQSKIFYSDNGSTAVEIAIKMAMQFWGNSGSNKNRFLCFEGAYHGDTFGAMSCSARGIFTNAFSTLLFKTTTIPVPTRDNIEHVKEVLLQELRKGDVAGFLFEPRILGAGGFNFYDSSHLDEIVALCLKFQVLTIADEVMTGFGRTELLFASLSQKHPPDILCLAKGITGGVLPLAATSCSLEVYERFRSEDPARTFFHGHSYTANPIACAAACASIDLLQSKESLKNRSRITEFFRRAVSSMNFDEKFQPRCCGNIFAIDFPSPGASAHNYLSTVKFRLADFFKRRGVLIRPLGNVLYFMPPYCTQDEDLETMFSALKEFCEHER